MKHIKESYSVWKRKNVTYRGIRSETLDGENGVYGSLGEGLYTVPASNKAMARTYGKLYYVVNARPKNPLTFQYLNNWEIYLQKLIIEYYNGEYNPRKFYKEAKIEDEVMKKGYDGVVITGREMVNYKPENVKYFENEKQLIEYYDRL